MVWCDTRILAASTVNTTCVGFDRIEFQGKEAKRLHTRHIAMAGLVIMAGPGAATGGSDPACRFPLPPNDVVDSDAAKPTAQVVPSYKAQIQPNLKWDAFSGLDP